MAEALAVARRVSMGSIDDPGPFTCDDPRAIDNMEDIAYRVRGSLYVCDDLSLKGYWAIAGLGPPFVSATRTNLPQSRGTSLYGLHVTGAKIAPFGSAVAAFEHPYDASSFSGFGFWARSATQAKLGVGLHTTATVADTYKGFVVNDSSIATGLPLDVGWAYYRVYFADLEPTGAALTIDTTKLREISFLFSGNVDVWLDDLSFLAD